jgi:hypothetical protein
MLYFSSNKYIGLAGIRKVCCRQKGFTCRVMEGRHDRPFQLATRIASARLNAQVHRDMCSGRVTE